MSHIVLSTWMDWSNWFDSLVKGPTVWISAWIHWDEHAWISALGLLNWVLLDKKITLTRWKVVLILQWNEKAIELKQRHVSDDLNRCINNYKTNVDNTWYEVDRWKRIKAFIDENEPESWLDLHTVSAPDASPYLFSSLNWYSFAKDLLIQDITTDWANAMNTIDKPNNEVNPPSQENQWVADYVNHIWSKWFTFEAWSHSSSEWTLNSYKAIINFLLLNDMIDSEQHRMEFIWDLSQWSRHVHMEYKHTFKQWWFEYKDKIHPWSFSSYKKGEIIWYDNVEWESIPVKAQIDGRIVLPKKPEICSIEDQSAVFLFWQNMDDYLANN